MESEAPKSDRRLLRFFGNPAIGIAGSLASIASVVIAVYLYAAGRKVRDLRYFVHPAKAVVVKAGQTSRLQITLDGAPVEKDVTAAQVAFWNQGAEPIRSEHMLKPLLIRTTGKSRILEARLRRTSRDVANIGLDLSALGEGEVRVSWHILERNDGGIVQLTYFSDSETQIGATATVEGQGDVRVIEYSGSPDTYQQRDRPLKAVGYVYVGMGIIMVVYGAVQVRRRPLREHSLIARLAWPFLFAGALTIVMGLFAVFWLGAKPAPPFGFE